MMLAEKSTLELARQSIPGVDLKIFGENGKKSNCPIKFRREVYVASVRSKIVYSLVGIYSAP
eukprot:11156793-Karenia_brevis.AAC.1